MNASIGIMTGNGGEAGNTQAAQEVLASVGDFTFREGLIGQAGIEDSGDPLPLVSRRIVRASQVILVGDLERPDLLVAGDEETAGPQAETAFGTLIKTVDARAYVQPVIGFDAVADRSPLRNSAGRIDLLLVHALDGIHSTVGGRSPESGATYDRFDYSREQIDDVGRMAFELARLRGDDTAQQPVVMSMDKSNVMETSRAWREAMEELGNSEYLDVILYHILADNAAMEIAARPHTLDVVVGDHLFGGIAHGIAAGLTAPGLVPAGWLNRERRGVFRPARPEGMNNAYGSILAASAALRYSLDMPREADQVENAVGQALADGLRTPDLGGTAEPEEVTEAVVRTLENCT